MRQKIIATGAGIVLVSLAAVGAFASQDAINSRDDAAPALVEDSTATTTATATETPEATETATATPTATGTAEADVDDDHGERDIKGIPTENPSHHPEDGDGECEHGETIIKTVPSGVQVNVPCETEEHGDHGDSGTRGEQPAVSPEARGDDDAEATEAEHGD